MKKFWIAAGILLSTAAMLLTYFLDIPHWQTLDIGKITASSAASVMLDKNGNEATLLAGAQAPIRVESGDIPEIVKNAFLAAEDSRFYQHSGVDVRRIFGALLSDLRSGSLREGASTITQQLIKLTHLNSQKTLSRKANEAWLALKLERALSKEEILTAYLNTAYFGHGAYGIESAARLYCGHSASALTLPEAAMLAGIVQSPSANDPIDHPEKAKTRRNYVLARMAELNFISQEEAGQARSQPIPAGRAQKASSANSWYRDQVIAEACEKLNITADELLTGGYTIETALDPQAQETIFALFNDPTAFPADAADSVKAQAAFCALDPISGEIRAVMGGREYLTARGLNRAAQSRRQPGSTLKPVSVYAAAIDAMGMSPSSLLDDSPRSFAGGYTPVNAAGHYYGLVTLRTALAKSLNVASVSLIEFTGISLAREYAQNAGIRLDDSDNGLSLALGGLTYGVTPVELAGAYAVLANGGKAVTPHTVNRITDRGGNILYEFVSPVRTVMSAESAFMLTSMLETAVSEGSAKALQAAHVPVAAKTGTAAYSGSANRDIWTAAYTPDWVACAWMGFDNTDENHVLPASESGSGRPARLLAAFLREVASGKRFEIPGGITQVRLDKNALETQKNLLLAPSSAPQNLTTTEIFKKGFEPVKISSAFDEPARVTDFKGETIKSNQAFLTFTIPDENADYLLLRQGGGEKAVVAVLSGARGERAEYIDELSEGFTVYTVIGRNRLLYENGVTLLGEESAEVMLARGESLFEKIESLLGI